MWRGRARLNRPVRGRNHHGVARGVVLEVGRGEVGRPTWALPAHIGHHGRSAWNTFNTKKLTFIGEKYK